MVRRRVSESHSGNAYQMYAKQHICEGAKPLQLNEICLDLGCPATRMQAQPNQNHKLIGADGNSSPCKVVGPLRMS